MPPNSQTVRFQLPRWPELVAAELSAVSLSPRPELTSVIGVHRRRGPLAIFNFYPAGGPLSAIES